MTAGLRDVLINILAGFLLLVLGTLGRTVMEKWLYRSERRLWRSFRGSRQLGICLTTRAGPLPRSTQRVSLAEVRAVAEITPILERLKIRYKLFGSMGTSEVVLANENLLILGSAFVNDVSRQVVELLGPKLPAVVSEDPRQIVVSDRRYAPQYSQETGRVAEDFALVVRAHNPYDAMRSHWIFLVMGCHGFGTAGASRILTHGDLSRSVQASVGDGAFAVIASVRVAGDAYQTSVLEVYSLPDA